ncbi:hypothetical protein PV08_09066 [Exophiala spinifera]|uniref:Uncharacterized protein n=1 Tax=Exophiala spinifera TaxID=91928 RepID=A0A0D2BKJ2_9EURO|nr:uncharacterized protein PV08_09066 [Exophiala spinifera]KIW11794.1 hypothetical protein PV08_09066 [Exophiala spinifera]
MSGDTLMGDPDDALFFPDTRRAGEGGGDGGSPFDTDAWDDEVLDVIDKASDTYAANRSIHYYLEYHKQEFLELLERQVNLIKTRSPVLKHNRITVYDKALLNITRSGRDLDQPAAIVVFCEEYLGISIAVKGRASDVTTALGRAMDLRNTLIRDAPDHADSYQRSPDPEPEHPAVIEGGQTHMQVVDTQVTRLWQVYEQAKADFNAVPNREGQEIIDAAKFLRDTAENAIQYLADKDVDPEAMAELQSTCNMAKANVVSLTGGRKRKFDVVDKLEHAPRGPEADVAETPTVSYGPETFEATPNPAAEQAQAYRRRPLDAREDDVNSKRERSEGKDQHHHHDHHYSKSSDSEYGAGARYSSYAGESERGRNRERQRRNRRLYAHSGRGHGDRDRDRSRSRRRKDHTRDASRGKDREYECGRDRDRDRYHRERSDEDGYWRRPETPPWDRHWSRERTHPYRREVDSYKPSRR